MTYNSDTVTFASFGFPGLYYPGLLTVGPSLVLEGYSELEDILPVLLIAQILF